jgi:hypothetical protein
MPDCCPQQFLFTGEVVVQQSLGNPRRFGDILDGCAFKALGRDYSQRRFHDSQAFFLGLSLAEIGFTGQ